MDKVLTLEQIKALSEQDIIELYRQGYKLGEYETENIIEHEIIEQGTSKNLTMVVSAAGTPPYIFRVRRAPGLNAKTDFMMLHEYLGRQSEFKYSFHHMFDEPLGDYTFKGEISDSGNKTVYSKCNVTIISRYDKVPAVEFKIREVNSDE